MEFNFKYFKAPIDEARGYKSNKICDICGLETMCIANYVSEKSSYIYRCFACLSQGKFSVQHSTEIGSIDEQGRLFSFSFQGLQEEIKVNYLDVSNEIKLRAIELAHCPSFSYNQEISYPFCCSDFMIYIGKRKKTFFLKPSQESLKQAYNCASAIQKIKSLCIKNPSQKFFYLITDDDPYNLSESLNSDDSDFEKDYFLFECSNCKKLRGMYD